jgi:thioredoxin
MTKEGRLNVANAVEITSSNFQGEVVESDVPVLIDFWAEWCGPCRMISPVIDELAGEYSGRVKVAKLDVDAEPGIASRYGVLSIPMVALFKDGEMVERVVGAKPKDRLVQELRLDTHAAAVA